MKKQRFTKIPRFPRYIGEKKEAGVVNVILHCSAKKVNL